MTGDLDEFSSEAKLVDSESTDFFDEAEVAPEKVQLSCCLVDLRARLETRLDSVWSSIESRVHRTIFCCSGSRPTAVFEFCSLLVAVALGSGAENACTLGLALVTFSSSPRPAAPLIVI